MSAYSDNEAAYLRAALRDAADSLEPRGDGLERIHARLQQPRPASARLRAAYGDIVMRIPARQDVAYQISEWLRPAGQRFKPVGDWFQLAYQRFAPAQAPGRHRSRAHGLLRPLAAMAVVMFIVAAGTYVAIDASTSIFPSSSSNAPSGGGPAGGHSGAPGPGASHSSPTRSVFGSGKSNPAPSPTCKASSPNAGQTTSAPPPPPSPSVNPSPTDSTSTDPSASPADTSGTSAAASAAPSVAPPVSSPTPPTPVLTQTKPPSC